MLTRQRSQSEHSDVRQLILPNERLAIVMVGLPARGKSFMAKKIYRYVHHLQIITKIFNFGSYRRIATKNTTVGKASASFFDPDNKQGAKIRRQCCIEALHDLISWYHTGGQIGILDATNTTLARRKLIREFFASKKSELEYNISILHVESICNDEAIIHNNIISVKLKNPDYCTVDAQKAIKDFKERIKMYKKAYVEVGKLEGSYIKVIDVGTEVKGYQIDDYISCRIFYFLMHLHLHRLSKIPKKPLLMQLKNYFENKKDNEMTKRLQEISGSVGAKFIRPAYDRPVHALAPHMRRASYLMWTESEDTYKKDPQTPKYSHSQTPVKVNVQNSKSTAKTAIGMSPMTNSSSASVKVTPLKVDKESLMKRVNSSQHNTPIQINNSVTAVTPTVNINMTVNNGGPYIRQRPKVRKSTLIHRLVSKRDDVLPMQPENTILKRNTSDSLTGYNSDNEEESDEEHNNNNNKNISKMKRIKKMSDKKYFKHKNKTVIKHASINKMVSPIAEYKTNEYKTNEINEELETDEFELNNNGIDNGFTNNNEDFHCELCGRTVLKKDTSLVDSRNSDKKVRICEVCLYESDSEDLSGGEMNQYNSVEMMDFMHSQPTSIMPTSSVSSPMVGNGPNNGATIEYNNNVYENINKLDNVQRKVQEMEHSVNVMVNELNNKNDNKHIKQELIKLQRKMQELFQ